MLISTSSFRIQAQAAPFDIKAFGHEVVILGTIGEQQLRVDNRTLLADGLIVIERVDTIDGVGVLIGGASSGGNACDVSPFVISFPKGEPAKIDGPLDQCGLGEVKVEDNLIRFLTPALPGTAGHRHTWSVAGGFKDLGDVSFTPNRSLGWDALRRHDLSGPLDLYKNAEIGAAIKALTGKDDGTFAEGLTVSNVGTYGNDNYVGFGCIPHSCKEAGSFIAADRSSKKVYISWKVVNQSFVVRPPIGLWPSAFRTQLKLWTKDFDRP